MLVHYTEQTSVSNMEADNLRRAASYQHFDTKGLHSLPVMLEEKTSILTAVKTDDDSGFETLWLLKNIDSLSEIKRR